MQTGEMSEDADVVMIEQAPVVVGACSISSGEIAEVA